MPRKHKTKSNDTKQIQKPEKKKETQKQSGKPGQILSSEVLDNDAQGWYYVRASKKGKANAQDQVQEMIKKLQIGNMIQKDQIINCENVKDQNLINTIISLQKKEFKVDKDNKHQYQVEPYDDHSDHYDNYNDYDDYDDYGGYQAYDEQNRRFQRNFVPESGYYMTGEGSMVYQTAGSKYDPSGCSKYCGYCGRCS